MKHYNDDSNWTYGLELEFGNVCTQIKLPSGCSWNDKDNTIVNSNGIANDPKKKLWIYGGEINTAPTNTINEQVALAYDIIDILTPSGNSGLEELFSPFLSHRVSLHVHIRVPGLETNLDALKAITMYTNQYAGAIFDITDPIIKPTPQEFNSVEAYKGAFNYNVRRAISHHTVIPIGRYKEAIDANTPTQFWHAHAPKNKENGKPLWYLAPRPAINLRQVFEETNTIEFRHFAATLDSYEIRSALVWCREFLKNLLTNDDVIKTPAELVQSINSSKKYVPLIFPTYKPYNHFLELAWQYTNVDTNSRSVVAERIEQLQKNCFVYPPEIEKFK